MTEKTIPEIGHFKDRCRFCNNKATLLCDMPVAKIKSTVPELNYTATCDKKICADCATRINQFDFCPDCVEKIKNTKRGVNHDR